MANDPSEIMLSMLRDIRSDLSAVKSKLNDHDKRFSQIERQLAGLRGDMAVYQEIQVDHGDTIRTITERLEKLERHAGLSDAFHQ